MILNMVRPNKKTEDLILSFTKNSKTIIKQTHREPEGTFEFKITEPRETFPFKPPISLEG